MQDKTASTRHAAFDWIDVLLGYVTICAGFGVAALLRLDSKGAVFKYVLAGALVAVIVARRVVIGPPRATSSRRGSSALGLLGAASLLFGLVIGTIGGSLLFDAYTTPPREPTKIDRDALERQLDHVFLRTCMRDGKPARGRACMTEEERAREAAEDEKAYVAERDAILAERARLIARYWQIAAVGTGLVLLGIALDVLRTRRDAARATDDQAATGSG